MTYRNHNPNFSGTSIVEKNIGNRGKLLTTVGCFGVGVKFGPALGECASALSGDDVQEGMNVFCPAMIALKSPKMMLNVLNERGNKFVLILMKWRC